MILGALGLVTAHSLLLFRHGLAAGSFFVRALVSGCLLLILVGLNPQANVDLVAHVAGFGAGLGMGALLSLRPRWFLISDPPPSLPEQFPNSAGGSVANWSGPTVGQPRPWLDRAALSVFLLLFALPWGQALHSVAIPALALLGCTVIFIRPRQAASSGSGQSPAQPSQTGPATQNPPSPADGTKPDSAGRPDV
jgi:hypothetical protein